MNKLLKDLLPYFFYGNIYIGLLAAGFSWSNSCLFLNLIYKLNYHLILLAFFSSVFVYNLDRIFFLSPDYENTPARSQFIRTHRNFFRIITTGCGISVLWLLQYFNLWFFKIIFLPACLTLVYLYLFSFKSNNFVKKISLLKPALLGFVWAFVTIFFPLIQSDSINIAKIAVYLFVVRFIEYFINGALFDFRDIRGDSSYGKANVFLFWKPRWVFLFLISILFTGFIVIAYGFIFDIFALWIIPDILVLVVYFLIVWLFITGKNKTIRAFDSPWFYMILLDGILFLPVIFEGVATSRLLCHR